MEQIANNIQRHRQAVRDNIMKSFGANDSLVELEVFKGEENDIEKAKWSVGDTKVYQGITWEVGGFNAKGTPLWRKKKNQSSSGGGNAAPSMGGSNASQTSQKQAPAKAAPAQSSSLLSKIKSGSLKPTVSTKTASIPKPGPGGKRIHPFPHMTKHKTPGGFSSTPDPLEEKFEQVVKNAKIADPAAVKKKAYEEAFLQYASEDSKRDEEDLRDIKYDIKSQLRLNSPDAAKLEAYANKYAEKELYIRERKKALAEKRKERAEFLDNTGHDFTTDELKKYLNEYNTGKEAAVVSNTWHYSMGRIGSTSATISIGSGKPKPFQSVYDAPDWRPIGLLKYSYQGYNGKYHDIEVPIQSWDDVRKNLSDTEDATLHIYKHPKQ